MEKNVNTKDVIYFYSFEELQKFSRETPNFRGEVKKSAYEQLSVKRLSEQLAVEGFSEIAVCYFVRRYEYGGTVVYEMAETDFLLHEVGTGHYYRIISQGKMKTFTLHNGLYIPYSYGFNYDKKEPNRVGVATKSKLKKWFDYLLEKEEAKKKFLEAKRDARARFTEEVAAAGLTVNWNNHNSGFIKKGGLLYRFVLCASGRILATLELDFSLAHPELKEFLALPTIG